MSGRGALLLATTTEHEQMARHMRSLVKHMDPSFQSVFPPRKGHVLGNARLQLCGRRQLISTVRGQNFPLVYLYISRY